MLSVGLPPGLLGPGGPSDLPLLRAADVRFIDRKVTVHLTGDTLVAFDNRREIARHARLADCGLEHLVLEHLVLDRYLEVLLRKPRALDRSEALHQARAEDTFTAEHGAF